MRSRLRRRSGWPVNRSKSIVGRHRQTRLVEAPIGIGQRLHELDDPRRHLRAPNRDVDFKEVFGRIDVQKLASDDDHRSVLASLDSAKSGC